MRFVGFGDITNKSTALCSIGWLVYPGQYVNLSYTTPDNCSDFDLHTPNHYPPRHRTLNPPGISYKDWINRLKFPDWTKSSAVGSIYPVDFRSKFKNDTSNVYSKKPQFIAINASNTFNNIRTTFPRIPYLLQSKDKSERCNITNKGSKSRKINSKITIFVKLLI